MPPPSESPKVSIALSTYNGESFLNEQLNSILNQSRLPFEVQIGDDGSTDRTKLIIEDFAKKAPFKVVLHCNLHRLGYGSNFIQTALRCDGDWIAFCDQDDVWLPNKLERYVDFIIRYHHSDLTMVTHSAKVVNTNLSDIGYKIPSEAENRITPPLGRPLDWGPLGCTQIFKKSILSIANSNNRFPTLHKNIDPFPHDFWCGLVANALGSTAFINEDLLLYRRHNFTASSAGKSRNTSIISQTKNAGHKQYFDLSQLNLEISNIFSSYITNNTSDKYRYLIKSAVDSYIFRSETLRKRADLYSGLSFFKKIKSLFSLLLTGGYSKTLVSSLSFKSFAKDIFRLIFGLFI